jgi:hypothetical protein
MNPAETIMASIVISGGMSIAGLLHFGIHHFGALQQGVDIAISRAADRAPLATFLKRRDVGPFGYWPALRLLSGQLEQRLP